MNQQTEQLEIKVAYLEQANTQLGDEVFRLRQELEGLREQLAGLTGRFEASQSQAAWSPEEEKPPHY
jgi:uncharacterized coiled-coil protein SlyX